MSLAITLAFFAVGLLGMPIAFALGFGSLIGLWMANVDANMVPQRMLHAINSFPLMSIPFFMLAGELMIKADIMPRLIGFAMAFVGRVRGGLGHATMIAAAGLSTVSGAAVADASALSGTLIPELRKQYGLPFASAVVAAAANLGPIIPPSGAMIVYALMAGPTVSIGGLFLAGVIPGLILTAAMMGWCSYIAWKRDYPLSGEPFSFRNIARQMKGSLVVFLMPVTVIGGIVGGAFTATEGSAIAVVYAMLIGFFVTKKLKLSDLPDALLRAAITTAIVGAMIAFASTITFLFTIDMLPQKLAALIKEITADPLVFLLIVAVMLFIVGTAMESNAAYIMLVPLFHPIAMEFGLDPLHFGFLFVFNLVIGMLTPPVAVVLMVVQGVSGVATKPFMKEVWPFVWVQYGVLVLCMLFPSIVTWLPRTMGY
ncbi:MAG: TRAP transporter large permease [Rhizobiales bacterium]|nr:TRAP transporter large permease [Hyphomicrobiales bacterium]